MTAATNDMILVDEREAARILSVSPRTLYTMRKAGRIAFVPMGTNLVRYSREYLLEWVAKSNRPTGGQ